MANLIINKKQIRYCGTDYTVQNVPYDMTDKEVVEACGVGYGWWVNGFIRRGTTVQFNVNYD